MRPRHDTTASRFGTQFLPLALLLSASLAAARTLPAAPVQDQQGQAKEVIEKIRKEMEAIDRLLNQATNQASDSSSSSSSSSGSSSSGSSGSSSSSSSGSKVTETLRKTVESQNSVIEKIDELLRIAQQNQSKNQSQGGGGDPSSPGQDPQKQQRPGDDRMKDNPDFLPNGEPKPGRENEPKDGEEPDKKPGEKRNAKRPPPDAATENLTGDDAPGVWGRLPSYLRGIFRRGGRPEVPAKYRRFEREFYKRSNEKKRR